MKHELKIIADGYSELLAAFRLTEQNVVGFVGYDAKDDVMRLYAHNPKKQEDKIHYFPMVMKTELAASFVSEWMKVSEPKEKPKKHARKGYIVTISVNNPFEEIDVVAEIQVVWLPFNEAQEIDDEQHCPGCCC